MEHGGTEQDENIKIFEKSDSSNAVTTVSEKITSTMESGMNESGKSGTGTTPKSQSDEETKKDEEYTKESNYMDSNDADNLFYVEPSAKSENVRIEIYKQRRHLELFDAGNLIGRFKIALGFNPIGHKEKEGDGKTPEGEYYICYINSNSQFHLFYGLSYPNVIDAQKALSQNRISQTQFNNIKDAIDKRNRPDWYTALGGEVGIHGGGNSRDWTWGCIALTDDDIDILAKHIGIGTEVIIYP